MSATIDDLGLWLGIEWSEKQRVAILRYQEWLGTEAFEAGGIGPDEVPRLFDRHIADSLAFLRLIDEESTSLVDIGSGVGLPGIPIAIAQGDMRVVLVDRAERRTRLARRAVRVLGLENVEIHTKDVAHYDGEFDVATFRASLPVLQAAEALPSLVSGDGYGIFAWSRKHEPKTPPDPPDGTIFSLVSEGAGVLESPAWLLRMQRSRST
ncbi:MAG: RsmG family class I SAM-dependent methyltransferase [Actinomycetota bacterium]